MWSGGNLKRRGAVAGVLAALMLVLAALCRPVISADAQAKDDSAAPSLPSGAAAALFEAIAARDLYTGLALIASGADLYARDADGRDPLLTAAQTGAPHLLDALLGYGVFAQFRGCAGQQRTASGGGGGPFVHAGHALRARLAHRGAQR